MAKDDVPFTNIVREMVSTGFSIAEVKQNLVDSGLDRKTTEKLIEVTEKKASVIAQIKVDTLVRQKLGKRGETLVLKSLRRKISEQRRKMAAINSIRDSVEEILAPTATKVIIVNKILRDYEELFVRKKEIKRELTRVLLEELDKKRPRREITKLKSALAAIEEL